MQNFPLPTPEHLAHNHLISLAPSLSEKELYKCGAKNQKQFSLEDTKQLFKANAAVVLVATAVVAVVAVHVLIVVVDVVAVLDVNLVVTSKVDFLTQS